MANKNNNNNTNRPEWNNVRRPEDWQLIADQLKHSKCSTIEEFYLNLDIARKTFMDQLQKNPILMEAYEYKKQRIGLAIEKNCMKFNLSMNTVAANSLPDYLERWKINAEWRSQLKAFIAAAQKPSVVNAFKSPLSSDKDE